MVKVCTKRQTSACNIKASAEDKDAPQEAPPPQVNPARLIRPNWTSRFSLFLSLSLYANLSIFYNNNFLSLTLTHIQHRRKIIILSNQNKKKRKANQFPQASQTPREKFRNECDRETEREEIQLKSLNQKSIFFPQCGRGK